MKAHSPELGWTHLLVQSELHALFSTDKSTESCKENTSYLIFSKNNKALFSFSIRRNSTNCFSTSPQKESWQTYETLTIKSRFSFLVWKREDGAEVLTLHADGQCWETTGLVDLAFSAWHTKLSKLISVWGCYFFKILTQQMKAHSPELGCSHLLVQSELHALFSTDKSTEFCEQESQSEIRIGTPCFHGCCVTVIEPFGTTFLSPCGILPRWKCFAVQRKPFAGYFAKPSSTVWQLRCWATTAKTVRLQTSRRTLAVCTAATARQRKMATSETFMVV